MFTSKIFIRVGMSINHIINAAASPEESGHIGGVEVEKPPKG